MFVSSSINKLLSNYNTLNSILKQSKRSQSILQKLETSPVLISASRDIYLNLAIEHWIYNNVQFNNEARKKPLVFMWLDEPSIVIGRHQNPWIEANLAFNAKNGIKLARRHSGGGCVYHDENNINISVVGPRQLFDKRQENLLFITKLLKEKYNVDCEPSVRHDIIHVPSGAKISGSASKLGRHNCYHHFTLLVDTKEDMLHGSIRKEKQPHVTSNSTKSTRTTIVNLKSLNSKMTVEQLIHDLAIAYTGLYGGQNMIDSSKSKGLKIEQQANEINDYKKQLESWDWMFGMTPKFKLERSLKLLDKGEEKQVKIIIKVTKGLFEEIQIICDSSKFTGSSFQFLIGTKFSLPDVLPNLRNFLQVDENKLINSNGADVNGANLLLATFILQMIHEMNA